MDKLNASQIRNWRKILFYTVSLYANLMTDEQIQELRDKMQEEVDKLSTEEEKKP
jgi:hypothetical protein